MTSSKLTLAALATLLVAGTAVASPVLAADSLKFDSAYYVQQLRYDGVNAIDADDYWNGTLRALVKLPNGHEQFQFFDKDSLKQVTSWGATIGN